MTDMENIDLAEPAPAAIAILATESAPPSATTAPIVEPAKNSNANGTPAAGFVPLVTVVGFHHAR